VERGQERHGDQRVYVSDISELRRSLQWSPTIPPRQGVEMLWRWANNHRNEIAAILSASSTQPESLSQLAEDDFETAKVA
jgi:dTDP-D-glucose 4,6-dehydratase